MQNTLLIEIHFLTSFFSWVVWVTRLYAQYFDKESVGALLTHQILPSPDQLQFWTGTPNHVLSWLT